MHASIIALVAFGLGVPLSQVSTQARPDFSGRWTIVGAPIGAFPRVLAAAGLGYAFEARQDQRTLTLVTGNDPSTFETRVRLDGVETRDVRPAGGSFQLELVYVSKAEWDGARLVVTTTVTSDTMRLKVTPGLGGILTTRQVWLIDANGDLIIETTNEPRTSKATYRKVR